MKTLTAIATAITLSTLGTAASAQDWNGFYVGGSAASTSMNVDFLSLLDYNASDVSSTVFAGYNHQMSSTVVLGIEAEYTFGSMSAFPSFPIDMENTYGVRARVGYTMDSAMIYGALGAEIATFGPWGAPSGISETTAGLSIGLGVEYALNEKMSVRAEYTYTDYGIATPTYFPGYSVTVEKLGLGIAYHF